MQRILSKQDFDRAVEGGLGRDRWFPLDEVGLKWGDVGAPFAGLEPSRPEYLHDGVVLCGDGGSGGGLNRMARSIDYGVTWRDLGVIVASYVMGIAHLGGGVAVSAHLNGHVARSTDYGAGWTDLGDQTGGGNLSAVVSLGSGLAVAPAGNAAAVIRTVDYGQTWTSIAVPAGGWRRWAEYLGKGVVLIGGDGISVARSQDYGLTWADITAQFPGQTGSYYAANIADGIALIATNQLHLWRTEDYGLTWVDQGTIPGATALGPLCYCGNGIVVASVGGLMLARSTDYGRTWIPIGAVPRGTNVTSLKHLERGIILAGGRGPRLRILR